MSRRVALNEAQVALLRQLAEGGYISYSQDGEDGWLPEWGDVQAALTAFLERRRRP